MVWGPVRRGRDGGHPLRPPWHCLQPRCRVHRYAERLAGQTFGAQLALGPPTLRPGCRDRRTLRCLRCLLACNPAVHGRQPAERLLRQQWLHSGGVAAAAHGRLALRAYPAGALWLPPRDGGSVGRGLHTRTGAVRRAVQPGAVPGGGEADAGKVCHPGRGGAPRQGCGPEGRALLLRLLGPEVAGQRRLLQFCEAPGAPQHVARALAPRVLHGRASRRRQRRLDRAVQPGSRALPDAAISGGAEPPDARRAEAPAGERSVPLPRGLRRSDGAQHGRLGPWGLARAHDGHRRRNWPPLRPSLGRMLSACLG
mmetsp:Transcript_45990/g.146870  ORF Transcript_45990/g.146870 Transcript_45990/m.146870 type:complete len:311 (+) Transcript_45990:352-1284(+)